jgi:branched-chain amino acid transport system permease protein
MLMYAVVLITVIRFRPTGILGWYMHSRLKTFVDEKLLKKPPIEVLEAVELEKSRGREA